MEVDEAWEMKKGERDREQMGTNLCFFLILKLTPLFASALSFLISIGPFMNYERDQKVDLYGGTAVVPFSLALPLFHAMQINSY